MNIEVKISAKFASGAEITLSERQLAQATKLIEGIILYGVKPAPQATPTTPQKRSRKGMTYRKWTPEEDKELSDLMERFPIHTHGRQHAIKQYAARTKRTPGAVEVRIYKIQEGAKKTDTPVVHQTDGNHAFGSGFQRNFNPNQA